MDRLIDGSVWLSAFLHLCRSFMHAMAAFIDSQLYFSLILNFILQILWNKRLIFFWNYMVAPYKQNKL